MRENREVPQEFLDWCEETRRKQAQGAKQTKPKKTKNDLEEWLDDVLTEPISNFCTGAIWGGSMLVGIFVGITMFLSSGGGFWTLILYIFVAGPLVCLMLSWPSFLLICLLIIWPIKTLVLFFRDSIKHLEKHKNQRLRLIWNKMEEGVGCILARKERLVLVIILVVVVLAVLLCLFPIPRYTSKVMHMGDGIIYQHDRWTGKSYLIYRNGNRREVKD